MACMLLPTASFATADRVDSENYNPNRQLPTLLAKALEQPEVLNDAVSEELEALEETEVDPSDELASQIIEYASKHVGRPYRYGSGGPKAFDCSGFTSYIFKNFGVDLTRSSRTQYNQGEKIANEDIKPGDLLFFKGRSNNSVGHVGLAVDVDDNGNVKFIHAATSKGVIYSTLEEDYYAKRYIGARRVL
ncbi:MAG: C40 family peptidase [Muribaculaceae bacterium]|nr:C40 family peptidase [Muribaculaceae bacterium]